MTADPEQAARDAAYNNSAAVADSAARVARWTTSSAAFRAQAPGDLDLAYGPRPRNRIDLFRASTTTAPLLVYIHGGYWQRNAKETFACLAAGPLARGLDVAMVGYTLAPEVRLTEIVAEVRAATRWLHANGHARGPLIVAGWSAGGHLTAMTLDLPMVAAGLAISGVFELEPIRHTYLNEKLGLDADEAAAMSPIRHLPRGGPPLAVAYGGAELPELCRQSRDFHAARAAQGLEGNLIALDGHDHFTILDLLESPDGALTETLVTLAEAVA